VEPLNFRECKKIVPLRAITLQTIKTCWGVEVQLHAFLTSSLDADEWSAPAPTDLTLEKEPWASTGYKAGWAPRAVWTLQQRIKSLSQLLIVQLVAWPLY
jgi:hypothetical protein